MRVAAIARTSTVYSSGSIFTTVGFDAFVYSLLSANSTKVWPRYDNAFLLQMCSFQRVMQNIEQLIFWVVGSRGILYLSFQWTYTID